MGRNGNIMKKAAAMALTAATLAQCTVFAADPAEELEDILERQEELSQESLLTQQLGLEELGDAMEDNGWQVSLKGGLSDGTLEVLDMDGEIPEDGYAGISFQVDPNLRKWLFQVNTGAEEPFLDLALYGDREQLALSIPQLYGGVVGLLAGNLREQYQGSGLSQLLEGSISSEDAPDLDMKFYPDDDDLAWESNPLSRLQEQIEEKAEWIGDTMQVEKAESDGDTVYAAHIRTADLLEMYSLVADGYVELLTDPVLSSIVDMDGDPAEIRDSADQMLDMMAAVLEDELVINFHVQDGLVASIDYDLYIDTAAIEEADGSQIEEVNGLQIEEEDGLRIEEADGSQIEEVNGLRIEEDGLRRNDAEAGAAEDGFADEIMTEIFEGTVNEAGIVTDGIQSDGGNSPGCIRFEIVFFDPADPDAGMDFHMTVADGSDELAKVLVTMRNMRTASRSETTVALEMTEGGGTVYSGTIYSYGFDAKTGDLDLSFGITDPDTGETVSFDLDGTFTQIDPGRGFTFVADHLGVTADGESAGLATELSVSADPGAIEAPADVLYLFQADQEELIDLATQISVNAQSLVNSMTETGSRASDSDYINDDDDAPIEFE